MQTQEEVGGKNKITTNIYPPIAINSELNIEKDGAEGRVFGACQKTPITMDSQTLGGSEGMSLKRRRANLD